MARDVSSASNSAVVMSPHARFGNEAPAPGEEGDARADETRDASRGPRAETRVESRHEPGAVASRGGAARAAAPCAMAARRDVTHAPRQHRAFGGANRVVRFRC